MGYSVKEVFYTLQGEGAHTGRPAVFCRFAGCNLWSGREQDRGKAICRFCDTDFRGMDGENGGRYPTPESLAQRIARLWPDIGGGFVVCTGGEPLLQLDPSLIQALHQVGFEIAVETNGTLPAPAGIDWVCVSPKAGTELALNRGDELKLVFPQISAPPERFEHLPFTYLFLQPMDGAGCSENTELAIAYCKDHPRWRLSLQTHKLLGIP